MISSLRFLIFLLIAQEVCCMMVFYPVGTDGAPRGLGSGLLFCEISLHIPLQSVL